MLKNKTLLAAHAMSEYFTLLFLFGVPSLWLFGHIVTSVICCLSTNALALSNTLSFLPAGAGYLYILASNTQSIFL